MIYCLTCRDVLPEKPYMHFFCCKSCKLADDLRYPVGGADDELPF